MRVAGTRIGASRIVDEPAGRVFEFLADLRNHWRLEGRFVELDHLDGASEGAATGGRVRIRGPLGLSRGARTRVLSTTPPAGGTPGRLRGEAAIGRRTRGRVQWEIDPLDQRRSRVTLSAVVDRAGAADALLLALGGRRWLRSVFDGALSNLPHAVRGEPPRSTRRRIPAGDALAAGAVAAVVSGAPSTLYALAAGRDPLEATLAAGSLLIPNTKRRGALLAAAVPVHAGLSLAWALALRPIVAGRRPVVSGAAAGLGIAALDLAVVGRRFARIRALPLLPQVADHVLYGATVGAVAARRLLR